MGVWICAALAVPGLALGWRLPADRGAEEAQTKPVIENIVEISHAEPPPTLDGVFAEPNIDAVARVKVTARRAVDRAFPDYVGGVRMELVCEYELAVREVFKPYAGVQPGATLLLLGTSAEIDRGDHVERTVDRAFPMLEVNHEYLLLLRWEARQSGWRVNYGPFGAWDLEGGVARCLKMSRLCSSLGGLTATNLLEQLRRAR